MSLKRWALNAAAGAVAGYLIAKKGAEKLAPSKKPAEDEESECDQCGGSGKKYGGTCNACGGEG